MSTVFLLVVGLLMVMIVLVMLMIMVIVVCGGGDLCVGCDTSISV